jgi:multidrug efflux system membrane fusion protein
MNIQTESHIAGKPIAEKPRARPVRTVRWFIIIGSLLVLVVGALVGFNAFRSHMIAQFFANNKPPPSTVAIAEAKSEVIPNLLTAVGDLAAVHQVNVTSDVSGRITDIMFTAGASVKAGSPLLQGRPREFQGAVDRRAARARPRQAAGGASVRSAGNGRCRAGDL